MSAILLRLVLLYFVLLRAMQEIPPLLLAHSCAAAAQLMHEKAQLYIDSRVKEEAGRVRERLVNEFILQNV